MIISPVGSSIKRFMCAGALLAVLGLSLLSNNAMAATGSQTQWEPIYWRVCMRLTAEYYDWIWESNNNPESGVNYDAIIDQAQKDMDSACNRVMIENNLPTR